MKNSRSFGKWESHARQFFGDDFWEDILSVFPDENAEPTTHEEATPPAPAQRAAAPAVAMYRTEREVIVHVELPGLHNLDAVDLYVEGNHLVVSGQMPRRFPPEQTLVSERFFGEFQRAIPLPDRVEEDQIRARYHNGLLEITLPLIRKRTNESKKRIPIQRNPPP